MHEFLSQNIFYNSSSLLYFQINLKQGINADLNQKNRDTCTACAGTMILEFAALSRLTGDPVYEVGMCMLGMFGIAFVGASRILIIRSTVYPEIFSRLIFYKFSISELLASS